MEATGAGKRKSAKRLAGLLVPLFALRSKDDLGIGDVRAARRLIDWLEKMGMGFLQVLPINETGQDPSPYNAISSIAIEPTTLDVTPGGLEDLSHDDFERITEAGELWKLRNGPIDYAAVKKLKTDILWAAFETFWDNHYQKDTHRDREFHLYSAAEKEWLGDYCLYRLLMDMEGGSEVWSQWQYDYADIVKARIFIELLLDLNAVQTEKQLVFYAYVQWVADTQWGELRDYAALRDIELMGDLPFGVSYYSADVFCNPDLFDLEWCGGAPPETNFKDDEFTQKWGQNWGIPIFRWDMMEKSDFDWWRRRVRKLAEIFGSFRIDHALGFYRIYSFPWRPDRNGEFLPLSKDEARERTDGRIPGFISRSDDREEDAQKNRASGEKYLRMVKEAAGRSSIIAEDLGHVPNYVEPSLNSLEIPGMKVPQWQERDGHAFPGTEYPYLSMATYATHDHEPLRTQWKHLRRTARSESDGNEAEKAKNQLRHLAEFAGLSGEPIETNYTEAVRESFLRALFASESKYASVMITDLLGTEQRFNTPGVIGENNWTTRMDSTVEELLEKPKWKKLLGRVREILSDTGRLED